MELYKLKEYEEVSLSVYARDPQHIVDLVEHYRKEAEAEKLLDDPNLSPWVRQPAKLEDITKVEKGKILFHVGMICMDPKYTGMNGNLFSEELQVAEDFVVAASPESIAYLPMFRVQLPSMKRAELYKFHISSGIFASLNFIYLNTPQLAAGMNAKIVK